MTSNASQYVDSATRLKRFRELYKLAHDDPDQASLQVLTTYFELSERLGSLLHGADPVSNATFPTFAAWTAETLRIDVAPRRGRQDDGGRPTGRKGFRPGRRIYQLLVDEVLGGDTQIAANLAAGEAMVLQEVGTALETLLQACEEHAGDWSAAWEAYPKLFTRAREDLGRGTPVRDPDEPFTVVMQAALEEAVQPYFKVVADGLVRTQEAEDPLDADRSKRRAELILLGTIRLEAYVQTRVQKVLERNLAYLPDALSAWFGSRITGRTSRSTVMLRRMYEGTQTVRRFADEAFAIAATRHVYAMVIGNEVLTLGRDLPLTPAANPVLRDRQPATDQLRYTLGAFAPIELQTVQDPDLWAAWQQFDRSITEGSRTAVDDWLRYEERMSFVVNLFRSRQQIGALYGRPGSMPPPIAPRQAPLVPVLPHVSRPTVTRLNRLVEDGAQGD